MFTRICDWFLSWDKITLSLLSSHLCLGMPGALCPLCLLTKKLYVMVVMGPFPPWHGTSPGYGQREGFQVWMVAVDIISKKSWTASQGGAPIWRLGVGPTTISMLFLSWHTRQPQRWRQHVLLKHLSVFMSWKTELKSTAVRTSCHTKEDY